MAIQLGWVPPSMEINLNRDGDFVAELISDLGDFAEGTTAALRFVIPGPTADIVWPATVVGPVIRWVVDKALVAAVLDAKPDLAKLDYATPDYELVWYRGIPHDLT